VADRQRSLFDDESLPAGGRRGPRPVEPAPVDPATARLAAALPPRIRLGTSSWSFPGWTGLVYAAESGRPPGEQRLARAGLAAYARHPLLRTVSLDRTFYAPLAAQEFAAYAAQVPADFRFVVKAPAAITDPAVRRPGSGEPSRDNPTFLDARLATESFVRPALAGLGDRAGPLVFQFPPLGGRLLADPPRLAARLAAFLAVLPRSLPDGRAGRPLYAVEVRDPQLVTAGFAAALKDAGCMPCLAIHARMPPADEQADAFGLAAADARQPVVARWNLHAGRGYEDAKAGYFPFDRLVEEDLPTRRAVAAIARGAAAADRDAFITINNKAEGSAPLSVRRLAEEIAGGVPAAGS
jgi:uncharacterized protein YecE (DUF72 family)